jgi:hypothetical protein
MGQWKAACGLQPRRRRSVLPVYLIKDMEAREMKKLSFGPYSPGHYKGILAGLVGYNYFT